MNEILKSYTEFLKNENINFQEHPDASAIITRIKGENGKIDTYAQVLTDKKSILIFSELPIKIPASKKLIIYEFISRINTQMILNTFLYIESKAAVNLKTSLSFEGITLNDKIYRQLLYSNFATADYYSPLFYALIFGDHTIDEILSGKYKQKKYNIQLN